MLDEGIDSNSSPRFPQRPWCWSRTGPGRGCVVSQGRRPHAPSAQLGGGAAVEPGGL